VYAHTVIRALGYGLVHELRISTERHTQVLDITAQVRDALGAPDGGAAVLVYVPHTTAGLTINEHADPMVARDFEMALEKLVPEEWGWQHIEEGEENAPSHPRASLMGPQVLVPLRDGELALGTWQGIFLCEFDGPRTRSVYVTVLQ
jgi:secondary thiamine-phosphate synthase enzyme